MSASLPYTKIPYAYRSWSIVSGCTPCSIGCEHCWAQAMLHRFPAMGGPDVRLWPERLNQPAHTRKPSVVFVVPTGDLFHDDVPTEFIQEVQWRMDVHSKHIFVLLTKRIKRASAFLAERAAFWTECQTEFPQNIWLGCSVEDQATADERVPLLLASGWPNLWVSVEPMLEPVSLKPWLDKIGGVIIGAESGHGARHCNPVWINELTYEVGLRRRIPCYVKQWRDDQGRLVKQDPAPAELAWPCPHSGGRDDV